ncbi:transporter substrate-binding domain-containing protein [Pseudomonas sp. PCH446]
MPTTWPTLMGDLQADKFDLAISGISVNMERQKQAFFSQPYQRDGKTPITLCSRSRNSRPWPDRPAECPGDRQSRRDQ